MPNNQIVLVGLPKSGKTTFIAALWFAVSQESSNVSLEINSMAEGDHEYLYEISLKWSRFEDFSRTNMIGSWVNLNLKKTNSADLVVLKIPDLPGETFRDHFDLRQWRPDYDQALDNINGVLLFIDPLNENNTPKLIYHANQLEKLIEATDQKETTTESAQPASEDVKSTPEDTKSIQWTDADVPNQVKLVEALQFIYYTKPNLLPLRIGVIISRWDKLGKKSDTITPETWLEKKMPFLHQYLKANAGSFESKVFGVSAQGCDNDDEDMIKEFYSKSPLERITVQEGLEKSADIAKPILWVTK
jgi:GTPase SAR1 family protein